MSLFTISVKSIRVFSISILLLTSTLASAQQTGKFMYHGKEINLLPGAVFMPKTYIEIDYSLKLDSNVANEPVQKNFMKGFTTEELSTMKYTLPVYFKYYQTALTYFKSLSKKVLQTYTAEELWYIYIYDQSLKTTLQTIN